MFSSSRRIGLRAATIVVMVGIAITMWAAETRAERNKPYLALGDSVVFGFITQAGFQYGNPENFVGYPDYVATALRFNAVNASCPGEATDGFRSSTGSDNGCRPFRAAAPLHVGYTSTQLEFAIDFLRAHRDTRLVTVGVGANDVFVLQKACANAPACINAGLPGVLATIDANVDAILFALRAAGFRGVLMIVNYYSLDYSDPTGTFLTQLLNQAITASAHVNDAVVADVFTAFQTAATFAGGKTCVAGLLNTTPGNQLTCDVHPSQSGQKLIAQTVEKTFRVAKGEGDGE